MICKIKYLALWLFCSHSGLTQDAIFNDIVINEILFNPSTDGFDYVELYNRSNKKIQVHDLLLANRNVTNEIATIRIITKDSFVLAPQSYVVITANEKWLKQNYLVPEYASVLQPSSLPTFADDEGSVILVSKKDTLIIDELNYNENWHFPTLNANSGISLERISYDFPTQNRNNWTSASTPSGYGTPGYENSQSRNVTRQESKVSVLPRIFSPDNNGIDDFAQVSIITDSPGWIANAIIFDASGRRVRYLIKNELLGSKNLFKWDGYDDHSRRLSTGIYIVLTQVFDTNGNVEKYKNCIVLDCRK